MRLRTLKVFLLFVTFVTLSWGQASNPKQTATSNDLVSNRDPTNMWDRRLARVVTKKSIRSPNVRRTTG